MNIIDATKGLYSAYDSGKFDFEKWEKYADTWIPGVKEICLADNLRAWKDTGYSWENDYLPVLNAVIANPAAIEETVSLFKLITEHLEEKIFARFKKTVDADVVLYLGLCNGAGWVTEVNGRTTVLLGIEKIIELNWFNEDDMNGLIIHEMGHVYQAQHGLIKISIPNPDYFLWQLFTEGVAMVFEQEIVGNPYYFHQDKNGWKEWCDRNEELILKAFSEDLGTMTSETQRYFGDWVRFEGHGDTGYYLGAKFVRYLLRFDSFDEVIKYDIERVKEEFVKYCAR